MFFAGRLPRPPWETRAKVNAIVKRHDQSFIRNTADRFRFESLQNRYQKFLELWDRQMNNRELGRVGPGGRRTSRAGDRRRRLQSKSASNLMPARCDSAAISSCRPNRRRSSSCSTNWRRRSSRWGDAVGDRSAGCAGPRASRQVCQGRQGRVLRGGDERRQGHADREAVRRNVAKNFDCELENGELGNFPERGPVPGGSLAPGSIK